MAKKPDFDPEVVSMAQFAKALSHPARIFILKKIAGLDSCCYSGDLIDEIPIGRSTLSRHLKELKFAGLIQGEIEPPYIKYCLNRENWNVAKKEFGDLFGL
jgi:DNA-binding transcriptional ArsR family regulator